jgi:hypothetical protein
MEAMRTGFVVAWSEVRLKGEKPMMLETASERGEREVKQKNNKREKRVRDQQTQTKQAKKYYQEDNRFKKI